MKKRQIIYTTVFLVVFGIWLPKYAHAVLVITEIMYDVPSVDSGREWIEVHNATANTIAITDFKLYENNTNKNITEVEGFSGLLHPGAYAVIADNPEKFLIDNPTYENVLFNSSFSLSNTGETLGLVDASGQIIHEREYAKSLGASGNGNSLQFFEGVFIEGIPTPGKENIKTIENTDSNSKSEASDNQGAYGGKISSHAEQVRLSTAVLERLIYIDIGRERNIGTGRTVDFEASASGIYANRNVTYIWNFGDGITKRGRKVNHEYGHAGTYNVVVNAIAGTSRAVARTKVFVTENNIEVIINKEGVLVVNNNDREVNVGLSYFKNRKDSFVFPKDTIIEKQSQVIFSWDTTGLQYEDFLGNNIKLYSQNKKELQFALE